MLFISCKLHNDEKMKNGNLSNCMCYQRYDKLQGGKIQTKFKKKLNIFQNTNSLLMLKLLNKADCCQFFIAQTTHCNTHVLYM